MVSSLRQAIRLAKSVTSVGVEYYGGVVPSNLAPPISAPLGNVETERMILRRLEHDDLEGFAAVFANPEVWEFPYGRAFTREETEVFIDNQIQEWDERGFGLWIALDKGMHRAIGYVGLTVPTFLPEILPAVEVGWRFDPAYWGSGYATEGATAALTEGFDTIGLKEICSLPQTTNPRSYKVCERLGMGFERVIEIPATDRRGAVDARFYTITPEAWTSRSASH